MKIVIIHYHLKTGGVTTVIRHQLAALGRHCEILVVTGDRAGARMDGDVVEIPGLGYDRPGRAIASPDDLAEQILRAIERVWPQGCDLIHIHNPTLAKNSQFLRVIKRLHHLGVKTFLQIHDFAEDGRPDSYFEESYPADCHYGVINRRDAAILKASGLKDEGIHIVPNAVAPLPVAGGRTSGNLLLYPVRAIRRKNLGEAILLCLYWGDTVRLAITQPPNSPADLRSYHEWVDWVRRWRLPVDFAAGRHGDFAELVGSARIMITTSITEGFGFCYLEPWTAGKRAWGRRLDAICSDFEGEGIDLEGLYERIDIPLTWIDAHGFAAQWRSAVSKAALAFGNRVPKGRVDKAYDRMTDGGCVDFGMLSEPFQRQVLENVLGSDPAKRTLIAMNPWLESPGEVSAPDAVIAENRRLIARRYAVEAFGQRLADVYQRVITAPVCHRIDKTALCAALFDLDRFSLLKWSTDG